MQNVTTSFSQLEQMLEQSDQQPAVSLNWTEIIHNIGELLTTVSEMDLASNNKLPSFDDTPGGNLTAIEEAVKNMLDKLNTGSQEE